MRKLQQFYLSLFCAVSATAQNITPEVKQLLDSTLYYTKATSLYAHKVNWNVIQDSVYKLAAGATTVKDLQPALTFVLNSMNDYHGRYLNPATYAPFAWFTEWNRISEQTTDKREKNRETSRQINDTAMKFSYQLLPDKTGYLRITGIGPAVDMQKEALKIRNAVTELAGKKVNKWIIDLRSNGGGNMNPMMAGLAPLIGNGFTGYLSNYKKDTLARWGIKNNNFYWDDYKAVDLNNKPVFKQPQKIAVLTSRYTVSSGEFVAANLKGRPNTRFFGEATGGYTTNTNWITIGGKLIICISSGFYCDRKGTMYTLNIPADEEASFIVNTKPELDDGIQKAIKWLNKK